MVSIILCFILISVGLCSDSLTILSEEHDQGNVQSNFIFRFWLDFTLNEIFASFTRLECRNLQKKCVNIAETAKLWLVNINCCKNVENSFDLSKIGSI